MRKFVIYIFLFAIISCADDTELTDSIYVADSENPELTAYSEWGYNTFGIVYERNVFTYSNNVVPLKVIVDTNYVSFLMQGQMNYDYMALKISIPDSSITSYQDLLNYNNTIISLAAEDIFVEMIEENTSYKLNILSGELNFLSIKRLMVDNIEEGIILSGEFNLKFVKEGIPESMSNGRFDFAVNDAIFFAF